MKKHWILSGSLALVATALPAHADYFWDGTDSTADADGGSGVWDTTTSNWDTLPAAGVDTPWSSTQTAVFGATPGIVSVAPAGITAANITFATTGYSVTGSSLTLGTGSISTGEAVNATIGSTINGSLIKTGAGTLTLAGSNSYTGDTVIDGGTLKVAASPGFRYYRFTVSTNFGNGTTTQDGYNQIGELHYYKTGIWTAATGGSATPTNGAAGSEQFWGNVNDNRGTAALFSKFGVGSRPYSLIYDFGTLKNFDAYNWSTANDSTPSRNPRRWVVAGSADNVNFTTLDDRSLVNQAGPVLTYTWSGGTGTYVAADNSANGGAANAYTLPLGTSLPTGSPVRIASGSALDLNGLNQTVASLADSTTGGGSVINSASATPVNLTLSSLASTNYSGTISDAGIAGAISLVKIGSQIQTLSGTVSNSYSGITTLGGNGKLLLAKTGGAIAIPGNINLSSSAFGGNAAGVVLGGNEQIADTSILTWTNTSFGGGGQADTFFRINGRTETIGGLVSAGNGGLAVIENRGLGDATAFGTGTIIINTTGANSYSYNGNIRNVDGGSNGGTVSITKTGPGTQILSGGMSSCTGPASVIDGVLRLNSGIGSTTMTVTGTGKLEGTGSVAGAITVQTGGLFAPGVGGVGTFTCNTGVTLASGGTLSLAGTTLAASATATTGGAIVGAGVITGALNVQAGASLTVGNGGIGTLTANSSVSVVGTTTMEINKTGATLTSDKVSGFTSIIYGGNLIISATGDTPVLGNSFQLFPPGVGGSFGGGFSSITGLPALPAGLQWETTTLLTTGTISVIDRASTPSFSPAGGGFVGAQSITISSDSGSTIYYTMDGTDPTLASPSGPSPITGVVIPVDSIVTLKAFATNTGFQDSLVNTATYRTVTVPKWNVDASGTWSTALNWANEVIPSGSGISADFTLPQSAARTVTLDSNRTVGSLIFGNTATFPWTLSTANSSILTLAVPSGTPTVEIQDVETTISTSIAGSQGFTKTGDGRLLLTGAKSFVGQVAINGGSISVDALALSGTNSPLGAGTSLSIDGGTLRYTGAGSIGFPTFNRTVNLGESGGTFDTFTPAGFWFISGAISGPGSLTKVGTRQMIIQSNNTYDGDTFINEGEIQFRTLDSLGSTVGKTVVAPNARVAAGGGVVGTILENIELNGNGGGNGSLQAGDGGTVVNYGGSIVLASDSGMGGGVDFAISGAVSGPGGLLKLTGQVVTLSGATSNTYGGLTTLGGTGKLLLAKTAGAIAIPGNIDLSSTAFNGNASGIVLAGDEQIADTSLLTWTPLSQSGGAQASSYLRLNGHTETVGGLISTGTLNVGAVENRGLADAATYGTGTLVINATGNYAYNGSIRDMDGGTGGGAIAITKAGTGTQTLSGGLTFTGATTVSEGTLELGAASISPTTVASGATLKGTGGTSGTLTVSVGGILAPGASAGTFSAGSTILAGSYACEIDGATADRLTVTGSLDITGATLDFTTLAAPTASSYVLASYTTDLTGTFSVTGLPVGYDVQYVSAAKQISLVKKSFSGFAAANGLSGVPTDDFDKDGLADAVEFVLGTSPVTGNGGGPAVAVASGNLVFTFDRADSSLTPDVTLAVEVGTTLGVWPDSYDVGIDTAASEAGITVTDNGASDTITLTVPQGADPAKFARLVVTVAP